MGKGVGMNNDYFKECIEDYVQLAWERHRIYVLKELGAPKPWTSDPILQHYYFCNVFRRLDKTTKWICKHIIEPNENNPRLWAWIILARYISRISTLERIVKESDWSLNKARGILREMQVHNEKIVTSAFVVNSISSSGPSDKVTYLYRTIAHYMQNYEMDTLLREETFNNSAYNLLRSASGVGAFMAYQYITDFKYTKRYLSRTTDDMCWIVLGLGAVRGLNRMLGRGPIKNRIENSAALAYKIHAYWTTHASHDDIEKEKHYTLQKYSELVGRDPTAEEQNKIHNEYSHFTNINLFDVQHWLCEYDKYCRGGSKKRRYAGV